MERSMKCVKYLLFIFNLIFALSGFALIVTGGVIQGVYANYLDFLGDSFFNIPILLVIVGCIVFVVTFFGCCGAIKENRCMTLTFSGLLALVFILEISAGIAAYVMKSDVRNIIEANMEKGLQNYQKSDSHKGVTETWNVVQHELKCCGAKGYADWKNTPFSNENMNSVPDSCCLSDIDQCGAGIFKMPDSQVTKIIYGSGCLDKLEELIVQNVAAVGGVGIAIAFIQVVGILFACCLAQSIKKEYETV